MHTQRPSLFCAFLTALQVWMYSFRTLQFNRGFVCAYRREGSAGLLRDGDLQGMSNVKRKNIYICADNMRFGLRLTNCSRLSRKDICSLERKGTRMDDVA